MVSIKQGTASRNGYGKLIEEESQDQLLSGLKYLLKTSLSPLYFQQFFF